MITLGHYLIVSGLLFTDYNLPFQVIGVVILVATVGVIILSRRETR
jgi:NADH-quinone oxidoreductase subunit J